MRTRPTALRPPSTVISIGTNFHGSTIGRIGHATKSTLVHLVGDPAFVRFLFGNGDGAPFDLKAYWAPTAQVGNGWSPYRPDGTADAGLFAPVTFGGGAAVATIPPDTAAFFSDWMPAACDRLLLVRSQAVAGSGWGFATDAGVTRDAPLVGGVSAHFSSRAGIDALANEGFAPNPHSHLLAVQIQSRVPGYTLLYAGSSILGGTTTEPLGRQGFPRIACRAMTRAGTPFAAVKANVHGVPTAAAIAASALAKIATLRPDFVAIQVANRNDPHDAATQDAVWHHAMDVAGAAQRHGGVPILVTATPWPVDAAADAIRQINNARARASGLPLFDYDALLSDGATPARLLPRFNDSGDNTHPGMTGHAYAGERLTALLSTLVRPPARG